MFKTQVTIKIGASSKPMAESIGKDLEQIADNLDAESIKILAQTAQKDGANQKIKDYKDVLKNI